jgi:hypothetical protein
MYLAYTISVDAGQQTHVHGRFIILGRPWRAVYAAQCARVVRMVFQTVMKFRIIFWRKSEVHFLAHSSVALSRPHPIDLVSRVSLPWHCRYLVLLILDQYDSPLSSLFWYRPGLSTRWQEPLSSMDALSSVPGCAMSEDHIHLRWHLCHQQQEKTRQRLLSQH